LPSSVFAENEYYPNNMASYFIGETSGTKSGNLALKDISGNAENDADRLITSAEAKSQATYEALGWDFDNVWTMVPGYRYPQLQGMNENVSAAPLSDDATLSALTVSAGTLAPEFDPATTSYSAAVANGVESIDIGAVANDENATVSGDIGTNALNVGDNSFAIVVTAESGDQKTYTIIVTREAAPVTYSVTVNSGTGSGDYAAGAAVAITASSAPDGQTFDMWTTADGVTFANANAASTTFTMPASAVTVTATYKDLPAGHYNITVQNDGNGTANANVTSAAAGDQITLTATPSSGYQFKEWQVVSGGVTITDNQFTMPANGVTIEAVFEAVPTFTVAVNSGTGSGYYAAGAVVAITANSAASGQIFDKWTTADGVTFANANAMSTTFTMPSNDVTVTATYKDYTAPGGGATITPPTTEPPAGPPTEPPAEPGLSSLFPDVNTGDWFYDAVTYVYDNGLMNGTDNGFEPDATLTRAMLITILARAAGVDTTAGDTWYSESTAWGVANGITDGSNLDGNITREQFVTMLYRFAALQGLDTSARADISDYTDAGAVSDWASDAMSWAVAVGLIQGRTSTELAPEGTATRAEAATMIQRYLEAIE